MKTTAYDGSSFALTNIVNAAIVFIVVLCCYMKWHHRRIDRLTSKIRGPKAYPIIGMAHNFIGSSQKIVEKMVEIINDYSPEPIKLWVGPYLAVIIMKPEDVQIVLNNSLALQKDRLYDFLKTILGDGLITVSGEKWRVHRRLIAPAFNINQLKMFLPVFNIKTQNLIRNVQIEVGRTQPFDLWNYISHITLDMICHTSMGYDHGTESNNEYKLFTENLTNGLELHSVRMYKPWFYPNFIFSIYLRLTGQHTIVDKIKKLPNQVIKEKKEIFTKRKLTKTAIVDKNEEKEKSFKILMDVLLESNYVNGNYSDEEIRDEVVTMMSAGSDAVAVSECNCLLLLAIHPDIQDKVYSEIYEVFGDSDKSITFEDIEKLVYLEQVLMETLRLFPIIPWIVRKLQGDVKLCNYTLPKGIKCIISPMATHHMSELYPDPWTFNPENFNPENVAKRHRYSFIPFSGGPRSCIGHKYAMLSMKVLLATFLQNFSVHTDVKLSDIQFKIDILMRSVHGYPVTIRRRNRRSRNAP